MVQKFELVSKQNELDIMILIVSIGGILWRISLINLEKNETLVGVVACSKKNTIEVFRKKSAPIKIALSDVPVTSRAAKAEKLVKTPKGDVVMSFRLLK